MLSFSDLPEEIIFAILSRVPAKSVGFCRCVSKPWRALLSEPKFIKTHLQVSRINPQESLAIFRYSRHGTIFYSAPLNDAHHLFDEITLSLTKLTFAGDPYSWYRVHGSCDGLLLVLLSDYNQRNVFVMNPLTREMRQVPLSPLAIDPYVGICLYGFGYDSLSDDYKMVTISYYRIRLNYQYVTKENFVDVYSLKTGSWKRLQKSPYYHAGPRRAPGAFVGGCLHWLARRTTDHTSAIVAFDLVEEKFQEVPPPPSLLLAYLVVYYELAVLGGYLCMYYADVNGEVWVMKEYGVAESWTKFMVDDRDGYFGCFLISQEQVVMMFMDKERVMWNLKQGTLKEIVIDGNSDTLHVEGSFVESLVSPHGSNESETE